MRHFIVQLDRLHHRQSQVWIALVLTLAIPSLVQAQAPAPIPSTSTRPAAAAVSTSITGQFILHGSDLNTRSAFTMHSDELSQSLGQLLKDDGKFGIPVVIVLKAPPDISLIGPAVTTNISQLEHGGFHLQMNVQLRPDFQSEDFSHELVRVLLAERILRNHQQLESTRQRVLPDWVLTGIIQAMDFRSRSRPSALFAAVFRSGQIFSIDKILSANPAELDALSRAIFETSTCALMLTLLDQPEGPLRFSKFLASLASDSKSDRELLQQFFPSLATSQNSLEKWWTLQMATLATPSALETMSIAETEEKLDEALTLHFEETAEEQAKTALAPAEAKKEGSLFGWLKWDSSSKKKEEETKPQPKSEKKVEEAKPQPKVEKKEKPKADDEAPPSAKPSWWNPFGSSRKTLFPFTRKKTDDAEETDPKKPEEKPIEKKKPKPEVKADKPKTEEALQPPLQKLPRKPASQRSISGKPDDLPEEKPLAKTKVETSQPAEEPAKSGRSLYNPLKWFRKDKPETAKKDTPPADLAKPKPSGARMASYPIEDYLRIWKRKDRPEIMERCLDQLNALKQRVHPLYKQVVSDYAAVAQQLAQGNEKSALDKLEALRIRRVKTHEAAQAVESYVDWYEATQNETYSGEFEDYLKLCRKLDKESHTRSDAISRYLDAIQKEYDD